MVRVSFQSVLQATIRIQHACAINPGDCIVEDVVASCLVDGEEDRFRRYISSSETDTALKRYSHKHYPSPSREKQGIAISDVGMRRGYSLTAAVQLDLLFPFNSTLAPECRKRATGQSSTTKHPHDFMGCLTTLSAMSLTGRSLLNLG